MPPTEGPIPTEGEKSIQRKEIAFRGREEITVTGITREEITHCIAKNHSIYRQESLAFLITLSPGITGIPASCSSPIYVLFIANWDVTYR